MLLYLSTKVCGAFSIKVLLPALLEVTRAWAVLGLGTGSGERVLGMEVRGFGFEGPAAT